MIDQSSHKIPRLCRASIPKLHSAAWPDVSTTSVIKPVLRHIDTWARVSQCIMRVIMVVTHPDKDVYTAGVFAPGNQEM